MAERGAALTGPVVTVIAPVRDGAAVLPHLIAALEAQTLDRGHFEVVIGDDGSADGGTDGLETGDGWIRVVSGSRSTGYAARNRAAAAARGEVLAFCDADCVPDDRWLEAGLAAIEDADVAAGFIRGVGPSRPTIWTLLDMDTFVDQERAVSAGGLLTGNLFVKREFFNRLGGFDESLPRTGDFEFAQRCEAAGARVVYAREAVVDHPTYNSPKPFLRKVWGVNRWYGWREARAGRRPNALRLRAWVPFVQTYRSRRYFGRPPWLATERLRQNGVEPRLQDHLRALPVIYLVLPYAGLLAQLAGWRAGRRSPADVGSRPSGGRLGTTSARGDADGGAPSHELSQQRPYVPVGGRRENVERERVEG